MYMLGQIFGLLGTAVTVITPQFRTKMQMLFCNALVNALNALNFSMLGQQGSAVFLCVIAIVQSFVSMWHERKQTPVLFWETVIFFLLYTGFGLFGIVSAEGFVWAVTRDNLLQLLPVTGAVMLKFSVFAKGGQKTRVYLLLNGAAWFLYTAAIGSAVFFTCIASMASAVAALWKYRRLRKEPGSAGGGGTDGNGG